MLTVGVDPASPLAGRSVSLRRPAAARCLAAFMRGGDLDLPGMAAEALVETLHAADDLELDALVDAIKAFLLGEDEVGDDGGGGQKGVV